MGASVGQELSSVLWVYLCVVGASPEARVVDRPSSAMVVLAWRRLQHQLERAHLSAWMEEEIGLREETGCGGTGVLSWLLGCLGGSSSLLCWAPPEALLLLQGWKRLSKQVQKLAGAYRCPR